MKYKVGELVWFKDCDDREKFGIGKIVETNCGFAKNCYLIELPETLCGLGHNGSGFTQGEYEKNNYWFIQDQDIIRKIETTKEDKIMCSNGKLNKGIESTLVQDVYKAVTDKNGVVTFHPVKMINLCVVRFDGTNKVYLFNNPSDKRLHSGVEVLVDTIRGEQKATVVSSFKIQKKYLRLLQLAFCGKVLPLKNVLGAYKTKQVKVTELIKIDSK